MTIYRTRATVTPVAAGGVSLQTFYWDAVGGTPAALATEAIARVRAFWVSWQAHLPAGYQVAFNPVADELNDLTGDLLSQVAGTAVANVAGTGVGDVLPAQTQLLVRYQTASFILGRRLSGRSFIPFPMEQDNSAAGTPAVAATAALLTAANLLGTTVLTPMSQRVWHRPHLTIPGSSAPVISRSASTSWSVLRSRRV